MLHWVQEEKTVVPSKFRPYFPESILSRGMFIQSVIFPDACQVHAGNNGPCRSKHLTSQFHVGISISGGIWVGCADRYNIICYKGNQDQKSIQSVLQSLVSFSEDMLNQEQEGERCIVLGELKRRWTAGA